MTFGLLTATTVSADVTVSVRVFDGDGKPAHRARVNSFWRANGIGRSAVGEPLNLSDPENLKIYWGNLGQMGSFAAEDTRKDGTCNLTIHSRSRVLYAMSEDKEFAGIGIVPPDYSANQAIEIHLAAVVTVTGQFRPASPNQPVDWTHVYVELVPDVTRPIAINRFISCGSFDRRFQFKVPPGRYRLNAYGASDSLVDDIDLAATTTPTVKIDGRKKVVDVGWLELTHQTSLETLKMESKKSGRWQDYKDHYGEPAPDWHTSFAIDIEANVNIGDFKGKWVVVEFWGFTCAPCLRDHLPKLIRFAEAHEASKDKLQIISVCIGIGDEIPTKENFEAALDRVETNVWKGTKLNFPVVVDNTFKTWERYGLNGLGTLVLVNPEGKLVEGDLATLESILNGKKN